jgi:hypothetical protein
MVAIPYISGAERVVYIGQHLPETKQKPVSETWKHDSNCELDSSCSAISLCFSTRNPWGNDTMFVHSQLLECMQRLNILQIWAISSRTYLNNSKFMEAFSLN